MDREPSDHVPKEDEEDALPEWARPGPSEVEREELTTTQKIAAIGTLALIPAVAGAVMFLGWDVLIRYAIAAVVTLLGVGAPIALLTWGLIQLRRWRQRVRAEARSEGSDRRFYVAAATASAIVWSIPVLFWSWRSTSYQSSKFDWPPRAPSSRVVFTLRPQIDRLIDGWRDIDVPDQYARGWRHKVSQYRSGASTPVELIDALLRDRVGPWMTYFVHPDLPGFAAFSPLEETDTEGNPVGGRVWILGPALLEQVRALLVGRKGLYRALVFVISSKPFGATSDPVDVRTARGWNQMGLNILPPSARDFSGEAACTMLVYEFEKTDMDAEARFVDPPGRVSPVKYLKSLRLA